MLALINAAALLVFARESLAAESVIHFAIDLVDEKSSDLTDLLDQRNAAQKVTRVAV